MAGGALKLSKEEARRAFVRYQLQAGTQAQVFERLRSVQFDPLSPVGSNHDLALQARVPGYRVGDWQETAYVKRLVYDGSDKQACLIAMSGWPIRRAYHSWARDSFQFIWNEHQDAVTTVLAELEARGPMAPKDFEFQEHKPEWRGSWYGPNLTKQVLRALWHTGRVMTHGRRAGQHVYDLTERIVPAELRALPELPLHDATKAIILDRHKSAGLIRPVAPFEVWSIQPRKYDRKRVLSELLESESIVPVEIEGTRVNAHPEVLTTSTSALLEPKLTFIAPLDQLLWDRRLVSHLFDFQYLWEVYVPEAKRKWGYYVLPVLFGDQFVARADVFSRKGTLEIRAWIWETGWPRAEFWPAFEAGLAAFLHYSGARKVTFPRGTERSLVDAARRAVKSL